jgi:hypothetical protein
MNRFTAVAVLIAVSLTILTPVGFAVNTPSVNTLKLCTDGSGSPVPPMPVLRADGSGSPVPPMPVLFEDRSNAVNGASARA